MAFNRRFVPRILFSIAAALYPALVFYFLAIRRAPVRSISLFAMAFALAAFIAGTSKKKGPGEFPFSGRPCSFSAWGR